MSRSLPGRVAGVFATKATVFALGLATTYLLARVLGPEGRGAYYLALLLPITLFTFGQLGIPSALVYLAGRGTSMDGLRTTAGVIAVLLSIACVVPALFARDLLRSTVVRGTTEISVTFAIATVPFLFVSAFAIAILLGRQALRTSNLLSLGQAIASVVLLFIVVGLAGWGVDGAVAIFFVVSVGGSIAATVAVMRLASFQRRSLEPLGPLLQYSLRVYPGSLASFFSYRADVFLLSLMLGSPSAIGLYALAVSLAELLFYIADSVSTAFFPQVSAAERIDADRQVPVVSRTTLLVTATAAIGLIPFAVIGIGAALPEFGESLLPFVVLLPGIISLSVSKVLSGYVSGIGHPAGVGKVAVASLIVNVIANIALIPPLGIVGAALSSTVSYTVNACLMVVLTSRLAKVPPQVLIVPTPADVRRLATLGASVVGRRSFRS